MEPVGVYLFIVNTRNTMTMCEIYSKLTIKAPERRQWRLSGVFIINFVQILLTVLVFPLLTLTNEIPAGEEDDTKKFEGRDFCREKNWKSIRNYFIINTYLLRSIKTGIVYGNFVLYVWVFLYFDLVVHMD